MKAKSDVLSNRRIILTIMFIALFGCSCGSCLQFFGFPEPSLEEQLIWSGDDAVRTAALKKLEKLDTKSKLQLVPVLVEILSREKPYCSYSVKALIKIGPPAVPVLTNIIKYGYIESNEVKYAVTILGRIGTQDAQESLNYYRQRKEKQEEERTNEEKERAKIKAKAEAEIKEIQKKALVSKTIFVNLEIDRDVFYRLIGDKPNKTIELEKECIDVFITPWQGVMNFYFVYSHYTGSYILRGVMGQNEESTTIVKVSYVPRILYDFGFGPIDHMEVTTYSGRLMRKSGKWFYEYYIHGKTKWASFD